MKSEKESKTVTIKTRPDKSLDLSPLFASTVLVTKIDLNGTKLDWLENEMISLLKDLSAMPKPKADKEGVGYQDFDNFSQAAVVIGGFPELLICMESKKGILLLCRMVKAGEI